MRGMDKAQIGKGSRSRSPITGHYNQGRKSFVVNTKTKWPVLRLETVLIRRKREVGVGLTVVRKASLQNTRVPQRILQYRFFHRREHQSDIVRVCRLRQTKRLVRCVTNPEISVRTYCGYTLSLALLACVNLHKIYLAALLISGPPVYSGKYFSRATLGSLALKTSILLRKRMMDVRRNQRELMTDSNKTRDSAIRFYDQVLGDVNGGCASEVHTCSFSSSNTWSYSLSATQKMMEVTASKQCIHFFRSDR